MVKERHKIKQDFLKVQRFIQVTKYITVPHFKSMIYGIKKSNMFLCKA
jgi:hypothetical protein